MRRCKKCGRQISNEYLLCGDCLQPAIKRTCPICGVELKSRKRYCEPCRHAALADTHDRTHGFDYEPTLAKPKAPAMSIAEVNRIARERGMSYGKIVTELRGVS